MIHLSQFDIHITVGNADGYVGDFSDVFLGLPNFATLQAALDEIALHDSGLIFVYPGNYPVASDCNFRGRVAVRGLGSIPEDCFFYASSDNTPFRYNTNAEVFIENIHFRSSVHFWRHFISSAGTGWKLWGNKARWAHGNTRCHGVWIGTASRDDYTCKFTHCQLSSGYNFVARGRQSRFTFHRIYSDRVEQWCWQCTNDGWAEYDITTNASALDYGPSSGEFQIDLFEMFAGWIDDTSHSHTADGLLEEASIRVWARVQAASADHRHSVQGLSLTHLSPLQGLDARSLHLVPQVRLTHRSFLELVSSRHEHFVSPAPVRHVFPLRHLEAHHRHWTTRISFLPLGWQFTARAAVPFDLRRASVAEQSRRAAVSSEGRAVVVPLRVG